MQPALLPQFAIPLREAGVRRLNISLDTLDAEKYRRITRVGRLSDAMAVIHAALDAGFDAVKLNAVLIGGFNADEIGALAALTLQYPLDIRFIELMPMVGGEFGEGAYVPGRQVLETLPSLQPLPRDGGVAALYQLPGALGRVGIISAVSQHFCAACNRIRLTADGKLKPCLHSAQEFSIKGLDRAEMAAQMQRAILAKPAQHIPLSARELTHAGRSMNRIGG